MKRLFLFVFLFSGACFFSCRLQQQKDPAKVAWSAFEAAPAAPKINIAESDLADKRDLACGMPVFNYLEDTAMIKGKIYGFCSKECKEEFLKDPEKYLKLPKNDQPVKAEMQ